MGESSEITILEVLLVGMLGMFLMALSIIVFFVVYQKRLLKQQKQQQQAEANYQKELLQATINSQEKERDRVAKDLHDDIGAMLNTIKLYTDQMDVRDSKQELLQLKEKTNNLVDETIKNVRRISYDLHPVILKNFGLQEALETLVNKINDSHEIKINFEHEKIPRLTYEKELALYRIIQELITNTLKHAGATQIHLRVLRQKSVLQLHYSDDGVGFSPEKLPKSTGLGLKNIESRLNLLHGTIKFNNNTKGTAVQVVLNINGDTQNHTRSPD